MPGAQVGTMAFDEPASYVQPTRHRSRDSLTAVVIAGTSRHRHAHRHDVFQHTHPIEPIDPAGPTTRQRFVAVHQSAASSLSFGSVRALCRRPVARFNATLRPRRGVLGRTVVLMPVDVISRIRGALESGDVGQFFALLAPDVTWRAPDDLTPSCSNRNQVMR